MRWRVRRPRLTSPPPTPGHDDAIALLLALELPEIRLLGISTVNGNSSLENTTRNAGAHTAGPEGWRNCCVS